MGDMRGTGVAAAAGRTEAAALLLARAVASAADMIGILLVLLFLARELVREAGK
jgi:hypothetical protein